MNPLTNVKNVIKLSEAELLQKNKTSWHDQYKDSAWIFVGGLPYDLTEGDVVCVFSQYGEIVNINLIRDKKSGKQKGFGFLCYEDQRSTILAVDNLNGIKVLGKTIRVDHVQDYKPPKDNDKYDDETRRLHSEGCAPRPQIPFENIKRERSDYYSNSERYRSSGTSTHKKLKVEHDRVKQEPGTDRKIKTETTTTDRDKKSDKSRSSSKSKRKKEKEREKKHRKKKSKKHKKRSGSSSNSDSPSSSSDSSSESSSNES